VDHDIRTKVTEAARRAWSIAEVSERLGVSKNFVNKEIKRRALRGRRIGRRIIVLVEDLENYLHNAQEAGNTSTLERDVRGARNRISAPQGVR
jgi:excisionase family DNA binding protein